MQKLVFTNGGGQTIDLTDHTSYGITNWEGLSGAGLNIQTQQVPFQDGGVFLDALIEQREISVTVAIQDNNDLSARYELKRQLISALNPKLGEGVLVYTNDYLARQIKAVPQLPIFENKNSNDAGTLKASVVFSCPSPYWEDVEETSVTFKQSKVITNNGDIPCQIKARLNVNSKNPILYNKTNQKEVSLNGTFTNNVFINTNNGEKKVEAEEMGFKWIGGGKFNSVCYGQSKLVYVGNICFVKEYFTDKEYLVDTGLDSNTELHKIIYAKNKGLFIAVGDSGTILTSQDGITWTSKTSGVSVNLNAIAYSEALGLFVVVGASNTILTSQDGTTWTSQTASGGFLDVIYANGLFVAVGGSGVIQTSPDGVTWTTRTSSTTNNLYAVTYSEVLGLFVIVGYNNTIRRSVNGITWSSGTITGTFYGITYADGMFVAVGGSGAIQTSTDGLSWTSQTSSTISPLYCVIHPDILEQFIAVGYGGNIIISEQGTEWEKTKPDIYATIQDVIYVESLNKFVAVGGGGTQSEIMISIDGVSWTTTNISQGGKLNAVAYSEDLEMFVAVGWKMQGIRYRWVIYTSTDGTTWTLAQQGDLVSGIDYLNGVIYSEDLEMFVAVGDKGRILTSTDGTTWTDRTISDNEFFYGVACKDNLLVAMTSNRAYTSSDGITWTRQSIITGANFWYVRNCNGLFIAVGEDGILATSENGINWTARNIGTDKTLYDVTYGNNLFIAVGASGFFLTSTDGITWILNEGDFYYSTCIAYGNNRFVAMGRTVLNSYIAEAENIISQLTLQSDMTFNLEQGENTVLFLSENESNCTLTYRQKYIGV